MQFFLLALLTLTAAAYPLQERETCCGCIPVTKCTREDLATPIPVMGVHTAVPAVQTPAAA
jgi:hypothetical protein